MKTSEETAVICVLHPGKTGGTYLKSLVRHNKPNWTRPIKLLPHRATAATTAQDFGAGRKLAFTFRDPFERFVSAFQSRRRQGRPTYNRMWTPAEATSFLFFNTANDLAEALSSPDERTRSAAYFAFNSIIHLRSNYAFHFETLNALEQEANNILACLDVGNFNNGMAGFLHRLGIRNADIPSDISRHENPEPAEKLSKKAIENLSEYWALELDFYNAFKALEGSTAR